MQEFAYSREVTGTFFPERISTRSQFCILTSETLLMFRCVAFALLLSTMIFTPGLSFAGEIYEVTVKDKAVTTTFRVQFGGGQQFDQWTAFDPESKSFVHLSFPRLGEKPAPVATIWQSQTGESIPLYQFKNAKHPLPRIESIEQLKVCPFTGSKDLKAVVIIAVD